MILSLIDENNDEKEDPHSMGFSNPERPISFRKKLIVFDLDNTLIYGSNTNYQKNFDFNVGNFRIKKRPHLDEFLKILHEVGYTFAVWSAGTELYVKEVSEVIFHGYKLDFVFSKNRCTFKPTISPIGEGYDITTIKKLKKVVRRGKWDRDSILVLDDNPDTYSKNYGNGIPIVPYFGEKEDEELYLYRKYLLVLYFSSQIRKIDKRKYLIESFNKS
jgi:RNA polymerase II subunit A small phosphatase-like protein